MPKGIDLILQRVGVILLVFLVLFCCAVGHAALDVRQVRFPSHSPGIWLSGTLTLPSPVGAYPAVVLVAGSGRTNRDEYILGHPLFLVLSNYLVSRGIAVLRYDKRGVGQSTGSYNNATSANFGDDAIGAVHYLASARGVDPARIGIIGHSEGGIIAPLVAVRDPKLVKFIVLLAPPALPGVQIILRQNVTIAQAEGATPAEVHRLMVFESAAVMIAKNSSEPDIVRQKILSLYYRTHPISNRVFGSRMVDAQLKVLTSPWLHFFLNYNPAPVNERLAIPVLALGGSKDQQVDSSENLAALRAELAKSQSHNYIVEELPGLNHLFQDSTTGDISEYRSNKETFSPRAEKAIGDWLVHVTKANAN